MGGRHDDEEKPVLLGVCPIGKFVFSHEDALRQKAAMSKKLDEWKRPHLHDRRRRARRHGARPEACRPGGRSLPRQGRGRRVHAALQFRHRGRRGHDRRRSWACPSCCGALATRRRCRTARVSATPCAGCSRPARCCTNWAFPFTYIENCRVSEPQFRDGVSLFLRAAAVVKAMRTIPCMNVSDDETHLYSPVFLDDHYYRLKFLFIKEQIHAP